MPDGVKTTFSGGTLAQPPMRPRSSVKGSFTMVAELPWPFSVIDEPSPSPSRDDDDDSCRTSGGVAAPPHVTRCRTSIPNAFNACSALRLDTISPVCCQYALASVPAVVWAGNNTACTSAAFKSTVRIRRENEESDSTATVSLSAWSKALSNTPLEPPYRACHKKRWHLLAASREGKTRQSYSSS